MNKTSLNLAVLAALPLFYSTVSVAETSSLDAIETIQVTGSRINRTDMETASPVTVISAELIAQSGYASVEEILSKQPVAAGMNLGATSNNGSGGSATVNLRGMGTNRTLVLLNGRRMVASGTGADSSVDLNTIPVAMIKSIEILKDGASAVYGSDAIAGVVNIITKQDFEGTKIAADVSETAQGDGTSGGVSILHGVEFAGGNLVIGAQFSERGKIIQADRDHVEPGCSSFIPEGTLGGKTPDGQGGFKKREHCYDFTQDSYAQTPNELFSAFSSFTTELDADTRINADLMYTRRESNQQMAPQPANIDLLSAKLADKYSQLFADTDGNVAQELNYRRRMTDAGPRISEQVTDTYRFSLGITGELESDASWDVSVTYGRNDSEDKVQNSIHAGNMEKSIYANQDLWFSGDALSRDFLASQGTMYTETNKGGNEQFIMAAGLSGVTSFDLGYAVGIENRFESGFYTPDLITQAGESTAAQQDPTSGNYSVQSVYGEVSMPVNDQLSLEAATRFDNYSTFGTAVTWKVGATYRFNDEFMMRSVAATGFRAPNVAELYGGNSGSFDYLDDPWGNAPDAQILVNYTGDLNLQPEESESFTFGMVWEITDGLSSTLDYWSFDITDAISRLNVQNQMDNCFAGQQQACDSINITPAGDLSDMTSVLTNVGSQQTSGVDWNIGYRQDSYRITLDTTYLIEFKEDGINYEGTIDGNMGGYSKLKANFTVDYNLTDAVTLAYNAQYIQGMDGNNDGDKYTTDDVVYHNVSAAYEVNDQWRINGGVKNLLDTDPEYVPDGNDMNTIPSLYDVVGRTFYLSTSYRF
ncbi:TonB-dependent receptor [Pseudoalteromonas tunicata]|uniref:TonB-dependent receptor plug domain-containing protein n=1 Tax=Pseudoalteromonas tunicata TaxID=314281 RepID=UPI00273E1C4B|nr:TonB-dependent receptor [Pseudoalteromonas tunicata]MDP5211488.1 TonB-dependent receptor [Pseudoalteromonas tunicata]